MSTRMLFLIRLLACKECYCFLSRRRERSPPRPLEAALPRTAYISSSEASRDHSSMSLDDKHLEKETANPKGSAVAL